MYHESYISYGFNHINLLGFSIYFNSEILFGNFAPVAYRSTQKIEADNNSLD